jgi:hypothetical protein
MGVTGGEIAIWLREAGIFLDREEQFRDGFIEAPGDEMRGAYYKERREHAGADGHKERSWPRVFRGMLPPLEPAEASGNR